MIIHLPIRFQAKGSGRSMNRKTSRNQRKIRLPKGFKKKAKTTSVEKVDVKQPEASCQTSGCGCGN